MHNYGGYQDTDIRHFLQEVTYVEFYFPESL
jgi:hypothetical protein